MSSNNHPSDSGLGLANKGAVLTPLLPLLPWSSCVGQSLGPVGVVGPHFFVAHLRTTACHACHAWHSLLLPCAFAHPAVDGCVTPRFHTSTTETVIRYFVGLWRRRPSTHSTTAKLIPAHFLSQQPRKLFCSPICTLPMYSYIKLATRLALFSKGYRRLETSYPGPTPITKA